MVIDRITDGTRIAQLLSSELDGREDDGLEAVRVVNADRDVDPTESGGRAFDVVVSTGAGGDERLAQVFVHPNRARVVLEADRGLVEAAAADVGLKVAGERDGASGGNPESPVIVDSGAAVKRATDVIQRVLAEN